MNIVVTGASRGIGFETVYELSRDPQNHIIAIARNKEGLNMLQRKCAAAGNNIAILQADLAAEDSSGIAEKVEPYGQIDVLINNAAALINKQFTDLEMQEWKNIFEVNFFGAVRLAKVLIPYLKKSGAAHIVNIGSMGGVQGTAKFSGLAAYSASKAALANLTECLAEELKEFGISVNCLALGAVNTEMLMESLPGYRSSVNAGEMGRFIAWFSTNAGRMMNGRIIQVANNTP